MLDHEACLLEDHDAVTSGLLGAIERRVGLLDQLQGFCPWRWPRGSNTDADAHAELLAGAVHRDLLDVRLDPLRHLERAVDLGVRQHDDELFASEAHEDVRGAGQHGAHGCRHLAQHLVADQVAMTIVDVLEVIDVDQQQGHGVATAFGVAPSLVEVGVEIVAVLGPGQLVLLAEQGELLVRRRQLRQRQIELFGAIDDTGLQRFGRFALHALILLLEQLDAVGQDERKQQDFHRRADLDGILREEVRRQDTESQQGIGDAAKQERHPCQQVQGRDGHAGTPTGPGTAEQRERGTEAEPRRDAHCGSHAQQERQRNEQQAEQQQAAQQQVAGVQVRMRLEQPPRELNAGHDREGDAEGNDAVRPPEAARPQVLRRQAVDTEHQHGKAENETDVVQVGGVAHRQIEHQVVDEHRDRDTKIDAEQKANAVRIGDERGRLPQRQRHHVGIGRARSDIERDRVRTAEVELHGIPRCIALALFAGQHFAGEVGGPQTLRADQVYGHVVDQRVARVQQPSARGRLVAQLHAEPDGRLRETEVRHSLLGCLEAGVPAPPDELADVHLVIGILEDLERGAQWVATA